MVAGVPRLGLGLREGERFHEIGSERLLQLRRRTLERGGGRAAILRRAFSTLASGVATTRAASSDHRNDGSDARELLGMEAEQLGGGAARSEGHGLRSGGQPGCECSHL
jgi:hypothetical protein